MTAIERIKFNKQQAEIAHWNAVKAEYETAKTLLEQYSEKIVESAIDTLVTFYSGKNREKVECKFIISCGLFDANYRCLNPSYLPAIAILTRLANESKWNYAYEGSPKAVLEFMLDSICPRLKDEGFNVSVDGKNIYVSLPQ